MASSNGQPTEFNQQDIQMMDEQVDELKHQVTN